MRILVCLFTGVLILSSSVSSTSDASMTLSASEIQTLRSVHMIFRHGNKQLDEVYEVRTGLLTDLGKNEMYQLGLYIRSRYPAFIKEEFDSNEIEILSSGANRVIQSSNLFVYGLYKRFNLEATWNPQENILYQAVPVLSIPKSMDKYLQVSDDCPRRKQLLDDDERELFIEKFLAENQDIVDAYVHNTGDFSPVLPKGQRTSEPIILLFDHIFLNVTKNQTIPTWSVPFLERESLTTARYEYFVASINSLEAQRLQSGNLVQLLTQNMIASVSSNSRKLQVYGAHDFTLMGLMKALGLEDKNVHKVPPTASVLLFELHQGPDDKEPYVKIMFRNDTYLPPWSRQLRNCKDPCYLSTLAEAVQFLVPEDYQQQCQMMTKRADQSSLHVDEIVYHSRSSSYNVFTVIISILMVVAAAIILVLSVFVFQNNRRKVRLYDQV